MIRPSKLFDSITIMVINEGKKLHIPSVHDFIHSTVNFFCLTFQSSQNFVLRNSLYVYVFFLTDERSKSFNL